MPTLAELKAAQLAKKVEPAPEPKKTVTVEKVAVKRGRKPLGEKAMTNTEMVRRYRMKKKGLL